MKRIGTILKRIGKFLLWTILVLVLLGGSLFIWLRSDPPTVTECEGDMRMVEHAAGASCVPADGGTLFAVSPTASQFYLAIGYPAVLRIDTYDNMIAADIPGLPEWMDEVNDGARQLELDAGFAVAPALEVLLQVDPDLIVSGMNGDELNRALSAIAPVIQLGFTESWKENMLQAGDVIGEGETAAEMLAAYEERLEILKAQFDDPSQITVSHVRVFPERNDLQLPDTFAGQIIADAGFSFPEEHLELAESSTDKIRVTVSDERMDLLDADIVFLYPGFNNSNLEEAGSSSVAVLENLQADPLFQTLSAAENGTVSEVGVYWTVSGIYSAHYILDDLFRHVAGVDPEEVAPNPLLLSN
ncbi:MAG: ABC transporter substrate-binding protein [Chloroflexota bacterium]